MVNALAMCPQTPGSVHRREQRMCNGETMTYQAQGQIAILISIISVSPANFSIIP